MELFYHAVFWVLVMVLGALELSKSSKDRIATTSAFSAFKNNYLVVYSLMMGMFVCSFLCGVCFFRSGLKPALGVVQASAVAPVTLSYGFVDCECQI